MIDFISAAVRSLPDFRGKLTLSRAISRVAPLPRLSTITMKEGHRMRVTPRERTESIAYWTGRYDDSQIRLLEGLLTEPGSVVLDVGANIGFYTIPLARHVQRLGGHVWAFEPVRANQHRLRENLQLNGLSEMVTVVPLALGNARGEVEITVESSETGNAIIGYDSPDARKERVQVTTLDSFLEENAITRCDLIKVDVEGYELLFLQGAFGTLRRTRPVIYGEFNTYWIAQQGHRFRDVAELLIPLGYRVCDPGKNCEAVEDPYADWADVILFPE